MNAKDYSKDYWNSDHWKPQQRKSRSCSSQFLHLGVTAKWWWYSWQIIQLLPFSDFLILIRWWWWVHMFLSSWVVPLWHLANYVRACFSSPRNSIWVTDWLIGLMTNIWAEEIMEVLTTRVCFSFVFKSSSTKGKSPFPESLQWKMMSQSMAVLFTSLLCLFSHALLFFALMSRVTWPSSRGFFFFNFVM